MFAFKRIKILAPVIVAYFILSLISLQNGFFWDTTHLGSLQAWWYYENSFKYFFLPNEIDSGHPSYFAMLLALLWKIFGVNLMVGHLMMLPFLTLLIIEVIKLTEYYFENNFQYVAFLILFNPILLGQATLVSPDIVLLAFFFFTLNAILVKNQWKIIIGALVLGSISMRGMMCIPYLFLFSFFKEDKYTFPVLLKSVVPFVPGALAAFFFLFFHYQFLGWVGYHQNSPWAPSFERVGFSGFFRNCVVFVWRLVDMGMIFIWCIMGGAVLLNMRKGNFDSRTKELILLLFLCFMCSVLLQFFYKYSLLHRYLFPLISIAVLVVCSVSEKVLSVQYFRKLSIICLLGLLSGNLWVFPDKIAKGWDATLAHLPYYHLRKQALNYLFEKNISVSDVSAGFPYNMSAKCIDLTKDSAQFSLLPMENSPFVLYSNISNDYTDDQLNVLKTKWLPLEKFGGWPIQFVLYKNPSITPNVNMDTK